MRRNLDAIADANALTVSQFRREHCYVGLVGAEPAPCRSTWRYKVLSGGTPTTAPRQTYDAVSDHPPSAVRTVGIARNSSSN